MESWAKLWTTTGCWFVPLVIGWGFYVRGAFDRAPHGLLVARAYWGLLVTLLSLAVLVWSAAFYVRLAKQRRHALLVPPNTVLESTESRQPLISWGTAGVFAIVVLAALVLFGVRYGESRIHLWTATAPLAEGFWASRSVAQAMGCADQPCFAMARHVTTDGTTIDGVLEYIPYLTDGVLLLLALTCLLGIGFLLSVILANRPRPPLAKDGLPWV